MTDIKPRALTCRRCGGRAEPWLRPAVTVRGVVVYKPKWMVAEVCGKCEAAKTVAEEAKRDERITKERLGWAGLGAPGLARLEFKDYQANTAARERVASMVRPVYSAMVKTGIMGNMVFSSSDAGTGKTLLAVCFAKAAISRGLKVLFAPWPELMLKMREASLSNRHLHEIERLTAYDVLVLDDIGAEKPTDFVVENLYLICDRWWRADRQGLIVTTNLSIARLGEVYGDRVCSRLAGMAALVDFDGCPDGRIEKLEG